MFILLFACSDRYLLDQPEVDGPAEMWLLVHRTDAPPDGPGIYRVSDDAIEAPLPLPDELISPHALADTGDGLLLGGFVESTGPTSENDRAVFKLDYDGNVVESYVQNASEGLAYDAGNVYVIDPEYGVAVHDATTWAITGEFRFTGMAFDLAVGDGNLFVLAEIGGTIVARRFGLQDGVATRTGPLGGFWSSPTAMTFWDGELLIGDRDDDGNLLRHVDPLTGREFGITRVDLDGWITAVAVP